jgi:hypothetical protein
MSLMRVRHEFGESLMRVRHEFGESLMRVQHEFINRGDWGKYSPVLHEFNESPA